MKKPIKQAMIMAAGLGTRLRPLTENTPKPLLPLTHEGECCLGLTIKALIEADFNRIIVNTYYLPDQIEKFTRQNFPLVIISKESIPLETGGGLVHALAHIDTTVPLLVVNGDTYIEGASQVAANLHEQFCCQQKGNHSTPSQGQPSLERQPSLRNTAPRILLALSKPDPRIGKGIAYTGTGDYFMDSSIGQLRHKRDQPTAPYVFIGMRMLDACLLKEAYLRTFQVESPSFSMIQLFHAEEERSQLAGVVYENSWCDLSTVDAYHALQAHLSETIPIMLYDTPALSAAK